MNEVPSQPLAISPGIWRRFGDSVARYTWMSGRGSAAHGAPHDLDRLAKPLDRPLEANAVPSLAHLRAAYAEPEDEPPARHAREAHGRHGDERGRPRSRLH